MNSSKTKTMVGSPGEIVLDDGRDAGAPGKHRGHYLVILAVFAVTLWAVLAQSAATALATPPPTVTQSFPSTGAEQSFTVPVGVSSLTVEAIGAPGQPGFGTSIGGASADVVGTLPVTSGEGVY